MELIEVGEREVLRGSKVVKGLKFDDDVLRMVAKYVDYLVGKKGADPKFWTEERTINELLRQVLRKWQGKNGNLE
jgi:hypothetical protein